MSNVEKKAKAIKKSMRKLLGKYDNDYEKLERKLYDLRDECKHPKSKVTLHVDPAGDSSESYFECSLCGKTW
jgi:hypothetical protein